MLAHGVIWKGKWWNKIYSRPDKMLPKIGVTIVIVIVVIVNQIDTIRDMLVHNAANRKHCPKTKRMHARWKAPRVA
jgi:hypothetical protein